MNTRYRKSSLNKAAVGTSSSKEPTSRDSSASSKTPKADYKSTAPSTSIDIFTDDEVESSVSADIYNANGKRIPKLKVVIQEWRAVANWRWKDADEDDCGICRSPFSACCNDCKFPGEDCPIVVGKCSHTFHIHCIQKWLQSQTQQRQTCPMCRQEWV